MDSLFRRYCFRIEVEIRLQVAEAESDDRKIIEEIIF